MTQSNIPLIRMGETLESVVGFATQRLKVDEGISDYVPTLDQFIQWGQMVEKNPIQVISDIADYAAATTPTTKAGMNEWLNNHYYKGIAFSECIKNKWIICFHRAVFVALLAQGVGTTRIRPLVMEGDWKENGQGENHLWDKVTIPSSGEMYLADSAFFYKGRPLVARITGEQLTDEGALIETLVLPNGEPCERTYTGWPLNYYSNP